MYGTKCGTSMHCLKHGKSFYKKLPAIFLISIQNILPAKNGNYFIFEQSKP